MTTTSQLNVALAGRYTIERELGAGGMATVYLAHDVRHHRKVALKVLRPELSAVLGADRFLAEIKTTANLQHPHILSLFDSGEADGTVFYVMPYVEGESLRDRLRREQQLPVDEAVRIAREVLDALEYAHQHGIVHRDIKPENILLHGGHAMVADFGIALAASRVEGGTRMTETGMSLGTPHYMSPEQAMGERVITPKADIYALGCVLYEMLSGEPPFTGASAQAVFARLLTDEPRSLSLQRRTISPHVEGAVAMALQKLPADRFASAAQFAEALGKPDFVGTGMRVAAAPALRRRGVKPRVLSAAPWALALLAGGLALFSAVSGPAPRVTRERIVIWDSPRSIGAITLGLAISPDGRTIAYVDSVAGQRLILSRDDDQLEPRVLTGTLGALSPVFSPDGEWIAFVADGRVKKVPRLGGSPTTIADTANTAFPALAWLDNDSIVYNVGTYALRIVHQDGGQSRMVMEPAQTGRGAVAVTPLPGGKAVLAGMCTAGCGEISLQAIDLTSDRRTQLGEEIGKGWYTPTGDIVFARRDGGVFSARFDLGTLQLKEPPVPLLDGVRANSAGADIAVSPSGTAIYARGEQSTAAGWELVWVERSGRATPVDSGWSFVPRDGIAISPDGKRVAVSRAERAHIDIWVKDLDRRTFTRLTFTGSNMRPAWSADGRMVLYLSTQGQGNEDLRARRADGTGAEETWLDLPRSLSEIAPTRDSTVWLVRLANLPTRDIALWKRGEKDVRLIIADSTAHESQPTLSPDGRWLAYISNESGRPEVYVRPFPAVESGRWQVSRNGGREPLWSHSGRELFFRGDGQLYSVAVRPGAQFITGEPLALFSTEPYGPGGSSWRGYDVAPDDRRFLFPRGVGQATMLTSRAPDLIRIDNWFAEPRGSRRK